MFLAIINDTYAEVKLDVKSRKADFQMGDFFKTGLNNVKGYLGIQDRGIDVENAIKLAAADDGFVTYEELRENLRKYDFVSCESFTFFNPIDLGLDFLMWKLTYFSIFSKMIQPSHKLWWMRKS